MMHTRDGTRLHLQPLARSWIPAALHSSLTGWVNTAAAMLRWPNGSMSAAGMWLPGISADMAVRRATRRASFAGRSGYRSRGRDPRSESGQASRCCSSATRPACLCCAIHACASRACGCAGPLVARVCRRSFALAARAARLRQSLRAIASRRRAALIQRFISHDRAVVRAYREDPLVHDRVTARLGERDPRRGQGRRSTQHPHGACRRCCCMQASIPWCTARQRCLCCRCAARCGGCRRFDALYHEIFNEGQAAAPVFARLERWMTALPMAARTR